eukprot:scaffold4022_cov58-Phaeocystis_antarctica.AAC.1
MLAQSAATPPSASSRSNNTHGRRNAECTQQEAAPMGDKRGSRPSTPSPSARCCVAILLCAEAMLPSARHACSCTVGSASRPMHATRGSSTPHATSGASYAPPPAALAAVILSTAMRASSCSEGASSRRSIAITGGSAPAATASPADTSSQVRLASARATAESTSSLTPEAPPSPSSPSGDGWATSSSARSPPHARRCSRQPLITSRLARQRTTWDTGGCRLGAWGCKLSAGPAGRRGSEQPTGKQGTCMSAPSSCLPPSLIHSTRWGTALSSSNLSWASCAEARLESAHTTCSRTAPLDEDNSMSNSCRPPVSTMCAACASLEARLAIAHAPSSCISSSSPAETYVTRARTWLGVELG